MSDYFSFEEDGPEPNKLDQIERILIQTSIQVDPHLIGWPVIDSECDPNS